MQVANNLFVAELDRLLRAGREVEFTPDGQSMRPFIEGGRDSVTLVRTEQVEVGDILLCRVAPQCYVLHRLTAVDGDRLTLMGDGNLQGEEHCTRADVIGKVIAVTRPGGRTRRPGKGGWWRRMLPVRRRLLWFYRKGLRARVW